MAAGGRSVDGGEGTAVGDDEGFGIRFVVDLTDEGRVVGIVETVVLELRVGGGERKVNRQF